MKIKAQTMLLAMLAGWINRQQQEVIEYLKAENGILKDELLKSTGKKRIILNDSQRRRLANVPYGFISFHDKGVEFVQPDKVAVTRA